LSEEDPGAGAAVLCTDTSPAYRDAAAEYFTRAGVSALVHFEVVDALEYARRLAAGEAPPTAPATAPPFDIIFNDIDKHAYPEVPELVAEPTAVDADTEGVRSYNRIVTSTNEWESSIVPIRDGVTISRRL
jgi:predicted O-methyltransferase YrrM